MFIRENMHGSDITFLYFITYFLLPVLKRIGSVSSSIQLNENKRIKNWLPIKACLLFTFLIAKPLGVGFGCFMFLLGSRELFLFLVYLQNNIISLHKRFPFTDNSKLVGNTLD